MGDLCISKSKTKEIAGKYKVRVSSEFYKSLDNFVREAIKKAADRSKANRRGTLKPADL